jgi:hypothetical protein
MTQLEGGFDAAINYPVLLAKAQRELADEKRKVKRLLSDMKRIQRDPDLAWESPWCITDAIAYLDLTLDEREKLEEADNSLEAAEDEAHLARYGS